MVSLVMHAAALGHRGAVYVLDMGDQIKVLDMARNVIRLSGFIPEEEIPIVFVGLRPGEKLCEELVGADETVVPSEVSQILLVQAGWCPESERLAQQLSTLERAARQGDSQAVRRLLQEAIPTFQPQAAAMRDEKHRHHSAGVR